MYIAKVTWNDVTSLLFQMMYTHRDKKID